MPMNTSTPVSIIIPVFNEEDNLPELMRRTLVVCRALIRPFEIVLVDDGSRDASRDLIARAVEANPGELIGVFLNRNYGQHAAVMAGFAQARGEIVVTLDADLQNPPEEIAPLVKKMDEGMDVVGSIRVPRRDNIFRRFFLVSGKQNDGARDGRGHARLRLYAAGLQPASDPGHAPVS